MSSQQLLFLPLFVIALAAFAVSCYQRFSLLALCQKEDRTSRPGERLKVMLRYVLGQKRVVKRPFGINHLLIFWSFLILLLANGEFLLAGLFPAARLSLLPAVLYHPLLLAFEVVSLVALVCVLLAAARRLFFAPDYLTSNYASARSGEAFVILAFIAALMVAFFCLHGAEIALGSEPTAAWMPVSRAVAGGLSGLSVASLDTLATTAWWVHTLVLLVFMNLLPRSKHMHILTAIPNCFFASLEKPKTLPRETFAAGEVFGVGSVERFTWKDILDSLTCTECGRCQDLCPAHNTQKPLNPRRIIHDIKVNLLKNASALKAGEKGTLPLIGEAGEGTVGEDGIWSCTTCGACTAACPVLIEQMPKILKLRRHLVEAEARFPEELLNLFENMEQRSNPWGIAPSERTKWCSLLGDRTFKPGETKYLFFVGCASAFDSRNKQVTVALATIMDRAGVSWGILGKDELCCGDSVRRLGNEYVFDRMARENVALLKEKQVTRVVTQCPHCFSTLKNDYRQYGLEIEVIHHSELIAGLLQSGRLELPKKRNQGRIVFHDSCYLGRHNDTYEAPRAVLAGATGSQPGELGRNRDNGFCCGAGGGRMWMEEQTGSRINLERVKEAMRQEPDTLCVSCPYCMTMMEDGLKDLGFGDRVRVKDIAEVAADAL